MKVDDIQRLSWSVTQRSAPGDRQAEQAFAELQEACGDLCTRHFGEDDGFESTRFELSGPLQGTRFVARRGRLVAVLSLQRFERAHSVPVEGKRPVEIRLVASLGVVQPASDHNSGRSWVALGLAGCAVGTLVVAALVLSLTGLLSAGLQAALLVPALAIWRTYATIGIAQRLQRREALGAARTRVYEASVADALPRWARLAPALTIERERISERLGLPPFRSPALALREEGDAPAAAASSAA